MITKYFSSGSSSSGAVEYIEKNETAKTLKGNNNLTRDLIKNNTNKLKYRSGVLSFGSDRPTKKQVMEIIELFEESTFAGLDKDQYNSLWVEHNDKDNYHIHFVIPRLELSTMKAFNPHYHKADQKRLLKMQDYINRKYHLINPFEAERRQTNLSLDIKPNMKNKDTREAVYKYMDKAFTDGLIENRDDVISLLEEHYVIKKSKNYIGIELKNGKHIRLKGVFYNENFTSREELKTDLERQEREHRADTYGELIEAREELDRLIQFKGNKISKQYPKECKNFTMDVVRPTDIQSGSSKLYADTKQSNQLEQERISMDTQDNDKQSRERSIHLYGEREAIQQQRENRNIHQSRGLENDSTRTAIRRSTERSRTEQQELNDELKRARERIHEQYQRDSEQLQRDNEEATNHTHIAIERYNERAKATQSENERELTINHISKFNFGNSIKEFTERFKEFGTKVIDKVKETLRSSREEEREATPSRKRSSRGFGMSR